MLTLLILVIVLAPVFLGLATSPRLTIKAQRIYGVIGLLLASGGILTLAMLLPLTHASQPTTSLRDVLAMKSTFHVLLGQLIGLILALFLSTIAFISAKKIQQTTPTK